MRKKTKEMKMLFVLTCMLANMIWISTGNIAYAQDTVGAEEIWPAGYHEYTTTENEAIDQWFGIERGTYLKEGICSITRAGTAKMSMSGTTTANSVCDKVKVSIYLNESSDGGSTFGTIATAYFSKEKASSCRGEKINISATSGWYYYASGSHSVTQGSTTEMTGTHTNAIKAL